MCRCPDTACLFTNKKWSRLRMWHKPEKGRLAYSSVQKHLCMLRSSCIYLLIHYSRGSSLALFHNLQEYAVSTLKHSWQSSPSTRPPRPRLPVGVGRERSSHRIQGKDADRLAGVLVAECRALAHLNLPDSRAQIQCTIREEMKRGSLKRTQTL